jgi:hypothetical protein
MASAPAMLLEWAPLTSTLDRIDRCAALPFASQLLFCARRPPEGCFCRRFTFSTRTIPAIYLPLLAPTLAGCIHPTITALSFT